ncbi:hypothetical protein GCM10009654_68540 [Streptomyces hebeiensis]|uniref:Uncharacterized protein n=1 Tax=Streptomyces hebeiensis TaxID=229486 RepID=A0ABN1VD44_9ACTN
MRITKKTTLTGVVGLTTTAVATLILAVPGSASAVPVPIDPVERYEVYLKGKEAAGDAGATEVLNKFQDLSEGKQKSFVEYINDIEVQRAFVEALSTGIEEPPDGSADEDNYSTERRKELYGGDVLIESDYQVEDLGDTGDDDTAGPSTMGEAGAQGTAGNKRVTHSVADTVLGIKVT